MTNILSKHSILNIYVIPHLPVENNIQGVVAGHDDQPVCKTGKYLDQLIKNIENRKFSIILTSPLLRSIQTVELCFRNKNVKIIKDSRLCPVDYGEFHGKSKSQVSRISHQFSSIPYPGGESYTDVAQRHLSFLEEILTEYSGSNLLLIGHEGSEVILHFLCNGLPLVEGLKKAAKERLKRVTANINHDVIYSRPPIGPFIYEHKSLF